MEKLTKEQGEITREISRMIDECGDDKSRIGLENAFNGWINFMNYGVETVSLDAVITQNELDKVK